MSTPKMTVADVAAIIAMTTVRIQGEHQRAVVRNLQITQGYWQISQDLVAILGASNVNWCGFATWASRTAGRFIRGEHVPAIVQALLRRTTDISRAIDDLLGHIDGPEEAAYARTGVLGALQAALGTIQESITQGNALVFADIGLEFARFTAAVDAGQLSERADLQGYLETFRPGATIEGGQDMLRDSFTHYWEAMRESEPARKAQHILLANLLVGYHEQTRLDAAIDASMGAPVSVAMRGILGRVGPPSPPLPPGPPGPPGPPPQGSNMRALIVAHLAPPAPPGPLSVPPGPPPAPGLFTRVMRALWRISDRDLDAIERAWNRVATEYFMQLRLPGGDIYMGADVAMATPGRDFPPGLEHIELPALRDLLEQLDRDPDSRIGSYARDWSDLADRMNYLCDFFRTRQCDASLLRQPFTEEQRRIIHAGDIPDGPIY